MFKKILLTVGGILVVLASFNGATGAQLLPFVVLGVLAYFEIYRKKDFNFWIVLLAILMAIINFSLSWIDLTFWVLVAVAFWKK